MAEPRYVPGGSLSASMGLGAPARPDVASLSLADLEVKRQAALDRITGLGGGALTPAMRPAPDSAMQTGSNIYYSPSRDRYAAGGVEFDSGEYDLALQASQNLGAPTTPSAGPDWRRIPATTFQAYMNSAAEGRGFLGNVGMGFRDVGEGLVGGAGRGLQMLGAEGAGQALVDVGEMIGPTDADDARDAIIAQNQGLGGKVGTAIMRSLPTIAASVGGGVLGGAASGAMRLGAGAGFRAAAAAGTTTGRTAGVATTIFPMELQSSWKAAEQAEAEGGPDVRSPDVQRDILLSTLFKTAVQTVPETMLAGGFSNAFRSAVDDVARRSTGNKLKKIIGAGALEGTMEMTATLADRVVFDPELRAKLNDADIAGLIPLMFRKYGEEAFIAWAAGGALGSGFQTAALALEGRYAPTEETNPVEPPSSEREVDSA